jgi:plastocyanin
MHRPTRSPRTLIVAALLGAGLTLGACSGGSSSASSGSAGAPTTEAKATVVIRDFMFSPGRLTVAPGASVRVVNEDQVAHTFTADGGGFTTGDVAPGASVSVTAPSRTGTYPFRCSIHQYMTGVLVVQR